MQAAGASNATASSRPVDTLARDVERAESLREVKDVQRSYAQLARP